MSSSVIEDHLEMVHDTLSDMSSPTLESLHSNSLRNIPNSLFPLMVFEAEPSKPFEECSSKLSSLIARSTLEINKTFNFLIEDLIKLKNSILNNFLEITREKALEECKQLSQDILNYLDKVHTNHFKDLALQELRDIFSTHKAGIKFNTSTPRFLVEGTEKVLDSIRCKSTEPLKDCMFLASKSEDIQLQRQIIHFDYQLKELFESEKKFNLGLMVEHRDRVLTGLVSFSNTLTHSFVSLYDPANRKVLASQKVYNYGSLPFRIEYSKKYNLFLVHDFRRNILFLRPKKNGGFTRVKTIKTNLVPSASMDQFYVEEMNALIAFRDYTLYLFNIITNKVIQERQFEHKICSVSYSSTHKMLAVMLESNTLHLLQVAKNGRIQTHKLLFDLDSHGQVTVEEDTILICSPRQNAINFTIIELGQSPKIHKTSFTHELGKLAPTNIIVMPKQKKFNFAYFDEFDHVKKIAEYNWTTQKYILEPYTLLASEMVEGDQDLEMNILCGNENMMLIQVAELDNTPAIGNQGWAFPAPRSWKTALMCLRESSEN